ncbi:MAG: cyclopropane-fatty-acyl-phospholipid synthase family protein [Candidatus Korobacteraceae bacterium]
MTLDNASWIDRSLLNAVRRALGTAPISVALPHIENRPNTTSLLVGTVRIADRATLAGLVMNPEVVFGDAYSDGRIEVDGDLVRVLESIYPSARVVRNWSWRLMSKWLAWIQANTRYGSSRNIHHHYDLPTEFYKLWLDQQMVYTCAYFPNDNVSLEEAQEAKMDLVCRKLWLRPGDTVVEAGCGWGALAMYMAERYGVKVRAFNISHEQIRFAREQAEQRGLTSMVEFVEDDYRNITGRYDAFVSVGMLEHVGREHYPELGRVIQRTIGEQGRGLLHFIGRCRSLPFSVWIRKRIFPGAYAPTLREAMDVMEPQSFHVLDVEDLRPHYARTIEHWLSRFDRAYDTVVHRQGENFARMWRLYLAGSIAAFRVGTLQLFQVVFTGVHCPSIPSTRSRLYTSISQDQDKADDELWTPAMS